MANNHFKHFEVAIARVLKTVCQGNQRLLKNLVKAPYTGRDQIWFDLSIICIAVDLDLLSTRHRDLFELNSSKIEEHIRDTLGDRFCLTEPSLMIKKINLSSVIKSISLICSAYLRTPLPFDLLETYEITPSKTMLLQFWMAQNLGHWRLLVQRNPN